MIYQLMMLLLFVVLVVVLMLLWPECAFAHVRRPKTNLMRGENGRLTIRKVMLEPRIWYLGYQLKHYVDFWRKS